MHQRRHARWVFGVFVVLGLPLALGACRASYPRCEGDDACKAHGEVCLNGQCQECRDDATCAHRYPDEKRTCRDGRCESRSECHLDSDCAALGSDLICQNDKCVPRCKSDADCVSGRHCVDSRCVSSSCSSDAACGEGRACVAGSCQDVSERITPSCRPQNGGDVVNLPMVHFEFNRYELTDDARAQLDEVLTCLRQAPRSLRVVVEGHCDDRGTQEYNLALGEKRALAVVAYFKQMGFEAARFTVRSKGENEPLCSESTDGCFTQNRRVQFLQKSP